MPTTREMHVLSHLRSPNSRVDGTSSALVLSPSLRTTLVLCVCACVTGNSHVFINIIIMLVFFNRHHLQAASVSAPAAVSQARPYNPIFSLCALQDVRESPGCQKLEPNRSSFATHVYPEFKAGCRACLLGTVATADNRNSRKSCTSNLTWDRDHTR